MLMNPVTLEIGDQGWETFVCHPESRLSSPVLLIVRCTSLLQGVMTEHWLAPEGVELPPNNVQLKIRRFDLGQEVPWEHLSLFGGELADQSYKSRLRSVVRYEVRSTHRHGVAASDVVLPKEVSRFRRMYWMAGDEHALWLELETPEGKGVLIIGPDWSSAEQLEFAADPDMTMDDALAWLERRDGVPLTVCEEEWVRC